MFSFLHSGENLNCAYPVVKETIPRSSLGYNTNNQYPEFPAKMSDGRNLIASWQSEAVINNQLLKETGITSNWNYRQFLTKNANEIMTYNFTEACNDVGYYKRFVEPPKVPENMNSSSPFMYKSSEDNTPVVGVSSSDLKDMYLSREQLNARKFSPAITQEELLRMK